METRHYTCKLYQLSALLFLILLNSCSFSGKFPLTVDDIDTLSIYKRHSDSLNVQKIDKLSDSIINSREELKKEFRDSISLPKPISTENKWTICTGTFRVKLNAERKFRELKKQYKPFFIYRNNLYYITIGSFPSKDSANRFRKDITPLPENYIMKILHDDIVLTTIASE
jgi:hypothetical protein